ncbi:hypothetical protein TNCV_3819211 [Trichonephila clavipes]|nr:hypothetical protein TNCV_3819211 [Trichonephila clavipes]
MNEKLKSARVVKPGHNLGFESLKAANVVKSIQMDSQLFDDESLINTEQVYEGENSKKVCKQKKLHQTILSAIEKACELFEENVLDEKKQSLNKAKIRK